MLSFFINNREGFNTGLITYPKMDWIRSRYNYELLRIKNYYNNREAQVSNTNLFAKAIDLIVPNMELDIIDYYKYVDANADYICRQLGITYNYNIGKIHKNILYNGNSPEIIYLSDSNIDIFSINKDYMLKSPIRVVYHESTNLDFPILNGRSLNTKLIIIELDIRLMCLMYYYWYRDRVDGKYDVTNTNSTSFIHTVILPTLLDSYMDISIWNRFMCICKGETIPLFNIKHPFNVIDYSIGIDNILHKAAKAIRKEPYHLNKIVNIIPCLYQEDMWSTIRLNKKYYTRQSEWVLWLSRVGYIRFLLDLLDKRGLAMNRGLISSLPVDIRQLKNRGNHIYSILEGDLLDKFNNDIEYISSIVGRR